MWKYKLNLHISQHWDFPIKKAQNSVSSASGQELGLPINWRIDVDSQRMHLR